MIDCHILNMKLIGNHELMMLTAIAAFHVAMTRLAVDFRFDRFSIMFFIIVLLTPTALTSLIHLRWQTLFSATPPCRSFGDLRAVSRFRYS
jgi:hypothetical protein